MPSSEGAGRTEGLTSALSPLCDFDAPLTSLVGIATSVHQRRAQVVRVEAPLVLRNGLAMRVKQCRAQAVAHPLVAAHSVIATLLSPTLMLH